MPLHLHHDPADQKHTLIATKLTVSRFGQPSQEIEVQLPLRPGYDEIKKLITPLIDGADLEHVSVLADPNGGDNYRPCDMFVDDMGRLKGLPVNPEATEHYRRFSVLHRGENPESIPAIHGPAVLLHRRIWF